MLTAEDLQRLSPSELEEVLRLASYLPAAKPSLLEYCQCSFHFELHSWQRDHLIPALEHWATTPKSKLLVHAPPREGKSIIVSQRLPAWILGQDPLARVRLITYNISTSAEFGKIIVSEMSDERYREWAPQSAIPHNTSSERFSTPARMAIRDADPSFQALGLQTGFVGKGASHAIHDDPYPGELEATSPAYARALDTYWGGTAKPRLMDASVMWMFHRWHGADIVAKLLAEGGWTVLRFPSLADGRGDDPTSREIDDVLSPRRSWNELNEIRESDPKRFYSLFQGTPLPEEGQIFRESDFQIVDAAPQFDFKCRGWDMATSVKESADYTSGALIGVDQNLDIYILDVVRWRKQYPDARKEIALLAYLDGEKTLVGIEDKSAGMPMVQDLLRLPEMASRTISEVKMKGDKKQRASGWAARARAGKLKLVRGSWNQAFINECLAFDGLGLTHDDQVDAVSTAWHLFYQHRGGYTPPEQEPPEGTLAHLRLALQYASGKKDDDDFGDYGEDYGDY